MTVKELKALIENVDENLQVVMTTSDNNVIVEDVNIVGFENYNDELVRTDNKNSNSKFLAVQLST